MIIIREGIKVIDSVSLIQVMRQNKKPSWIKRMVLAIKQSSRGEKCQLKKNSKNTYAILITTV